MTFWSFLLAAAGIGCYALAQRWWRRRVQQSKSRYRQLIELAPIGIAVVGTDGHLRSANPALRGMLGLSPTQQINVLTFPPLVEAGIIADLRHCLESATPLCTEHSYTGPSGQRIYLRCHLTPLPDEGAVLALFEDVTVRKQAQEHLEQMQRMEAGSGSSALGARRPGNTAVPSPRAHHFADREPTARLGSLGAPQRRAHADQDQSHVQSGSDSQGQETGLIV